MAEMAGTLDADAGTVLETLAMNHLVLGQVALGVATVRQLHAHCPQRARRLLVALLARVRGGQLGLGEGMLASAAAPHIQSLGWQLAVELRSEFAPTVRGLTLAAPNPRREVQKGLSRLPDCGYTGGAYVACAGAEELFPGPW